MIKRMQGRCHLGGKTESRFVHRLRLTQRPKRKRLKCHKLLTTPPNAATELELFPEQQTAVERISPQKQVALEVLRRAILGLSFVNGRDDGWFRLGSRLRVTLTSISLSVSIDVC